jgi:site-specific recombinase XerD
MLDHCFLRPCVCDRIRANLLGSWISTYIAYLTARGHPRSTIRRCVRAVEHFGVWLDSQRIAPEDVTRTTIRSFLHEHLPTCHCPTPAPTYPRQVRAALGHLLRLPNGPCQRPRLASPPTPVNAFLESYREHLRNICGLAESTCSYRIRYAQQFLWGKFGDGPMDWTALHPKDLMAFTAGYASRCRPGSAQVAACSLRSLLRFLQLHGHGTPALVAAIPRLPNWQLNHLPRTMSEDQLRRFLAGFDRSAPTGRRDYAMARCQIDLGLRASEVIALRLEDLDWRRGTLRITGGKVGRTRELPLTEEVGHAIAEYLRRGRPVTPCRHVFVRHTVPVGRAIGPALIRGVIRRAFARVEGCAHLTGTHVLRHTAATRLHRRGASLKEVADVLGHRSLDTTALYTKVDLPTLAAVALPWPEVQP